MSFDLQFTATYSILSGLLANDSDPEDDDLSALLESAPVNGTVNLGSDGLFTYTPNGGFTETDQFTYRATDGFFRSAPATVTIDVVARNDAPLAVEDFYQTDEDVILTVASNLGVLSNDTDAEGDTLSAILVSPPEHGTLSLNDDGSFEYVPDAQFKGNDL